MTGIVANFFSPAGIMLIEQKFAFFCLFMRNLPIATKYAYTSSQTWDSFNRKPIDAKYRAYMNMLVGWHMIPEENFVLQAEVAFVGVIGSHAQRSEVRVKFLPWPRNEKDLLAMRKRVDVSSKTMFFAPTGEVLRSKSCRRKAARQRIMGRDANLPECEMQSIYDGMSSLKNKSERSLGKIRTSFLGGKEQKLEVDATGPTGYSQEDDEKILFKTAANGGEVPIEDLFLYFLRAVQKKRESNVPSHSEVEPDSGATSTACPIFPAPQEHRIFSGTRSSCGARRCGTLAFELCLFALVVMLHLSWRFGHVEAPGLDAQLCSHAVRAARVSASLPSRGGYASGSGFFRCENHCRMEETSPTLRRVGEVLSSSDPCILSRVFRFFAHHPG